MEFANNFSVPVPIEQAWLILMDVERIAPCLPGAKLTESIGPDRFKGVVNIRLGPMAFTFNGNAQITDRSDRDHTARIVASGNDNKGRGSAQAVVDFNLESAGTETSVKVRSDLTLSGSVAQFARSTGIIHDVAAVLIRRFEQNLREQLASDTTKSGSSPVQSPDMSQAPTTDKAARPQALGIVSLALSVMKQTFSRLIANWSGKSRL